MQVVEFSVDVDQDAVRKQINKRIEEVLMPTVLLVDIDTLVRITSMSRSSLERDILCDPRMRILERRKEKGKRYWFYKESLEAIKEILDDW